MAFASHGLLGVPGLLVSIFERTLLEIVLCLPVLVIVIAVQRHLEPAASAHRR